MPNAQNIIKRQKRYGSSAGNKNPVSARLLIKPSCRKISVIVQSVLTKNRLKLF
jgi:hypothetical protein